METGDTQTLWDNRYRERMDQLESWLYGKKSLDGATRYWFLKEVKNNWSKNIRFLDAGCGGGVTAYQMNQDHLLDDIHYIGADFSQCMLDLAKEKVQHKNVRWVKTSLEFLPFSEEFDCILLRAVLAHVLDPVPVLKSVANALRPNGCLYIVFWNNPTQGSPILRKLRDGFWDNAHSEKGLRQTLDQLGFQVEHTYELEEKSARDDHRIIWKTRKFSSDYS